MLLLDREVLVRMSQEDYLRYKKMVLAGLTTPEFRLEIEEKLINLLSKHIDKDLTRIEGLLMRLMFEIGRKEVDRIPEEEVK